MPDDKMKPGGQDRTRIDVSEPYELRDWAEKFGVSQEEIKPPSARWATRPAEPIVPRELLRQQGRPASTHGLTDDGL
jgi:Protein of unknown function (DUF3606)